MDELEARRRRLNRMRFFLLLALAAFSAGGALGFVTAEDLLVEGPALRFFARAAVGLGVGLASALLCGLLLIFGDIALRVRRRLQERLRSAIDDKPETR